MRSKSTPPTKRRRKPMSWLFRSAPSGLPATCGLTRRLASPALAAEEDVAGEAGRTAVLHPEGEKSGPRRLVLVGLGPAAELDADTLRTAAAEAARKTERVGGSIAWLLDDSLGLSHADQARAVVDGLLLGTYDPGRWKGNATPEPPFERLILVGSDDDALRESGERAATVATAANRARDLANTGANLLTPEKLADRALELAAEHANLSAEALGLDEARELGMGAFSAVAQGSHNPPRMIVLRYEPPSPAGEVLLGLVGKAVTFDTGGISIKKALYMEDMKGDMAGGATVIEGLGAIAELGLPLRTLAVVGADRELRRRRRLQARRHPPSPERQDDRGDEHRRRGAPRARGRAHARAAARRDPPRSTSQLSPER